MKKQNSSKFILTVLSASLALTATGVNAAKTTIKLWSQDSGKQLDPIKKAISYFEKDNPNYEVKLESVGGGITGYNDKLITALATGTAPDVFQINEFNAAQWAIRGFLEPLDKYAMESKFNFKDLSTNVLGIHKYKGKVYGLPKDFASFALYYNKESFAAAGLPDPINVTWSYIASIGPKLAKYNDAGRLIRPAINAEFDEPTLGAIVGSNNGEIFNLDKEKFTGALDGRESIEAISFMMDLVDKTKVATAGTDTSAFQTGKQAMMTQGPWHIPTYKSTIKFKWGTTQFPYFKKPTSNLVEAGWGMASRGKRKDVAWKLLSYLGGYHGARAMGETGYAIPAHITAVKELKLDKDQYFGAFWDGADLAVPMYRAQNPAFQDSWDKMVVPRLQKIVSKKMAVDQALREAAKQADAEMSRLMPRYRR